MVLLENILSPQIVQKLGWTLLHFVWQAAAIALLLVILLRVLRKSTANLRYIIACSALAVIVLMPITTFNLVSVPNSTSAVESISISPGMPAAPQESYTTDMPLGRAAEYMQMRGSTSWQERAEYMCISALPYIVAGWLIGVLALSLWHLGGWAQLQRLKRRMVIDVDASIHSKLNHLAERLGVSRAVRLMESALVQVPTVVGWLRPVILLPASALTGLTVDQLEAMLAHELAHIKRFDYLVNMLQTVVEILGFYHPAVWWISHKIRAERENCCDDLAASLCGDRVTYAKALTCMEELRQTQLAIAASGGSLLARISRLVGKDSADKTSFSWIPAVTAILLIIALAIPTTLALTTKSDLQELKPKTDARVEGESINARAVQMVPPGRFALRFDGFNDYLEIAPSMSLQLEAPFTVELWIKPHFAQKPSQAGQVEEYGVLAKGGYEGGPGRVKTKGFGINVYRHPKEAEFFIDYCTANENGIYAQTFGRYPTKDGISEWIHLVHTFNEENYTPAIEYPLAFGKFLIPSGSNFKGEIGEIRIWSKVRTQIEIDRYKNTALTGDEPNLLACWTFEESQGQVAHDISPNRNHARLGSTSRWDDADPQWAKVESSDEKPDVQVQSQQEQLDKIIKKFSDSTRSLPPGKSDDNEQRVRESVESFLAAALAGEHEKAARFAYPSTAVALQADDMREILQGQDVRIVGVYAGDWNALAISSVVQADHGRVGSIVFRVKKLILQQKVHWLIDDIDLETLDTIEQRLTDFLNSNTEADAKIASARKLQDLGKAMVFFAQDHQRALPDTLQEFAPYLRNKQDIEWLSQNIEYLGKGKTEKDRPDTIIAYDKSLLKSGQGTNVLFLDTHVGYFEADRLEKLGIISEIESSAELQRVLSAEKLKRLGLAVVMYADEHDNKLPDNLQVLKPYIADEQVFLWVLNNVEYLGQGKNLKVSTPGRTPIAYDKTLSEKHAGTNVVFLDGHVESITSEKFNELVGVVKRIESANKLSNLGKALLIYANDHEDKFPDSLMQLQEYLKDQELTWVLANVNYRGKGKTVTLPPNTLIAYDKTLLADEEGTNVLFINGRVEFLTSERLKELGIGKTAIEIETRILKVSEDFLKNIGLDANSIRDANAWPEPKPVAIPSSEGSDTYSLILNDLNVSFLLRAAQAQKGAETLTAPKVIVLDGEEARLEIQEPVHYISGYTESKRPSGEPEPKHDSVILGTFFQVKPELTPDKENIYLDFELEIRQLRGFEERNYGKYLYTIPKIDVVSTKTRCLVPDGKTLLIGGHKVTAEVERQSTVPILGKLPIIGRAFRSYSKIKDQRLLLILIKPTVLLQK